jgi:hypothetical protein
LSEPANFFMILLYRISEISDQLDCQDSRLSSRTDTRHRETDIDGRADTTEEELSFQEDLTVSDGNDLDTILVLKYALGLTQINIR